MKVEWMGARIGANSLSPRRGENSPNQDSRLEPVNHGAPPLPAFGHPLLHSEWRRGAGRGGVQVHGEGQGEGCRGAFTLIEVLVYLSVLMVVIGVGFSALYQCMDASQMLKRNTADIADALRAGEDWRGDVRAARGGVVIESKDGEQIVRIPRQRAEVSYRFAENTIFRRIGNGDWLPLLANVKGSEFVSESRSNLTVCRWELELQSRSRKLGTIKPLFTFIAVPEGEAK
jgi:type II secretory pathway pseudopilin PulG